MATPKKSATSTSAARKPAARSTASGSATARSTAARSSATRSAKPRAARSTASVKKPVVSAPLDDVQPAPVEPVQEVATQEPAVAIAALISTVDDGVSASISSDHTDVEESSAEAVSDTTAESADAEDSDDEEVDDLDAIRMRLMNLQQQLRAAKVPVVIVFEGWDTAGKGALLGKLIEALDPRGYKVYPIIAPTAEERRYPVMRRYWMDMPLQGNISLFCGSWYREVSNACFENKSARKHIQERYDDIVNLESQQASDGTLIIKFFLHISRKEQKKRLKALESKRNTRWRVEKADWDQNERYEDYLRLYDAMISRTHFDGALWHVLHTDDKRGAVNQMYQIVTDAFERVLAERAEGKRLWDTPFLPHLQQLKALPFPQLDSFTVSQTLDAPYKAALDKAQKKLRKLHNELYRRHIPLVLAFEGWDAAGKGGCIKRVSSALDPRGFEVVPIASPSPVEKGHQHLWRFWNALPKDGHIAIFDRTWYGRLMVERIEGFCTEAQWKRGYEEINRFERELTEHGTIVRKFWLQIDADEQLRRFNDRQNTPEKQWKITEEDWRNREKWPQYEEAVNDMLQRTSTTDAPWVVVEANNKQFARLKVLHTIIEAIEQRLDEE